MLTWLDSGRLCILELSWLVELAGWLVDWSSMVTGFRSSLRLAQRSFDQKSYTFFQASSLGILPLGG